MTALNLSTLHDEMMAQLAVQFPDILVIDPYPERDQEVRAPSMMVQLLDLEGDPDSDPGTEQLPMIATFELRVVMGIRTPDVQRQVRIAAAAIGVFLHLQRWQQPVGPARVIAIEPDDLEPELEQFAIWRVEFTHEVNLGASVWENGGTVPQQVLGSFVPRIGPPNVEFYRDLSKLELP